METWRNFLGVQTPVNIKIDQEGLRAWGFKSFKLSQLVAFAGRHQTTLRIYSPYIVLTKPKKSLKGMDDDINNDDDDDDDDHDDDDWPTPTYVSFFIYFFVFGI